MTAGQIGLFDSNPYAGALPHAADCDTSAAAAAALEPKAGALRRQVFEYIEASGDRGATDHEIHIGCRMRRYTAAPRRRELVMGGAVVDSGRRRPTDTGSSAKVWVSVPECRRAAAAADAAAADLRRSLRAAVDRLSPARANQLAGILSKWAAVDRS